MQMRLFESVPAQVPDLLTEDERAAALRVLLETATGEARGRIYRELNEIQGGAAKRTTRQAKARQVPAAPSTPDFRAELPREKQKAARRKNRPMLWARYADKGAPVSPHPALPEGAFDGRSPVEVAQTALRGVLSLLEQPEVFWLFDRLRRELCVGHWHGDDPDEPEPSEIADLDELMVYAEMAMWLPGRDADGQHLDTERLFETIWALALEVAGWQMAPILNVIQQSGLCDRCDDAFVPRWFAEAVLADHLDPRVKLKLVNVSKREAAAFIKTHHSKLPQMNSRGLMFTVGVRRGDRLVAVATAGTPTGHRAGIDHRRVLELTRIASDGTVRGASSMLAARMIDLLPQAVRGGEGPTLFVTYSLTTEEGATYRGLKDKGLRPVAVRRGHRPTGTRRGADAIKNRAAEDKVV